jgi:hypothetical protein
MGVEAAFMLMTKANTTAVEERTVESSAFGVGG